MLLRPTFAGLLLAALTAPALAQPIPAPRDEPYPGTLRVEVDATDLDHKVFRVRETLAVKPGPLTLLFPRWIPGHHAPTEDVAKLAGLHMRTPAGDDLPWARNVTDTHAFHVEVPRGVSQLLVEYQHLSPVTPESGRTVMTREMLGLQWHSVLLYPAGHEVRRITVQPVLRLPAQWQSATALRPAGETKNGATEYQPVSLETLVDSPVFAGRYMKHVPLDDNAKAPVVLHVMADDAAQLAATDAQLAAHRALATQADRLFGARHFAHYDFLFALSESFGGIGLEHHQSSENGVKPGYFVKDWDKPSRERWLLPHEYVHSWNGKFRRPRDLWTPDYNQPMRDSLLWLYEGQTQYWGRVLAARSGLLNAEYSRQGLAQVAADYAHRAGRNWRSLQDTTNEGILSAQRGQRDWRSWQRSFDYYDEATLIWLDADTLIREKTNGARSLDDFARAFFGTPDNTSDGRVEPLLYGFDDIVRTLNGVAPHDWAKFLRERLDSRNGAAPLDGLARSGWKLVYTDQPSDTTQFAETEGKYHDFWFSLGVQVAADGKLQQVLWDSPAFRAGLSPAATLIAVNSQAFKPERLKAAVGANKDGSAPIELLLREGDGYRTVKIDYRGGLRYPKLERMADATDRLEAIFAPR